MGRIRRRLTALLLCVACTLVCCDAFATARLIKGPAPEWVKPYAVDLTAETPVHKSSNGNYYLLSDEQTRLGAKGKVQYVHLATRALDQRGVGSVAHVSFDFDPSFQTPQLHVLRVYRGTTVQDRLASSSFKFLQREMDLESRIYDGAQTVDITLSDIRPGDVVEYAYSLQGSNPVLAKSEYGRFNLQWTVPIAEVNRRLVAPVGEQLRWRTLSGAQEPKVTQDGAQMEWSWHLRNVAGASFPEETPPWWSPFARVEWAQHADWPAVARWGESLIPDPKIADAALRREVSRIATESSDPEQRIGAVLQFVQSHVRYLGIEMGAGSYAPRAPDVVYQQRFGDCKDKTVLAMAMLRALGVEAYPALVNTRWGSHLDEHLPSPGDFNHEVLVARVGGKEWWLDATRLPQNAPINLIGQPNYGKALVLDGKSQGLSVIPVAGPSVDKKLIAIRVDATKGFASSPTVEVVTRFEGVSAEKFRRTLQSRDSDELQHDYENWYARDYRGLKRSAAMTVRDDIALNRVTTEERYQLPTLVRKDTNGKDVVWLFARDMKSLLAAPSDSVRSAPLVIKNPQDIKVILTAMLPDDRVTKSESASVRDPAFEFTSTRSQTGREMRMEYEFRTLSDHVNPSDLAQHISNLESARSKVGYTMRPQPLASETKGTSWRDLMIVFGPSVAFGVALAFFVKAVAWFMGRARVGLRHVARYSLTCAILATVAFITYFALGVSPPGIVAGPLTILVFALYGGKFFASRATTNDGVAFGFRKGARLAMASLICTVTLSWLLEAGYRVAGFGDTHVAGNDTEKARLDAVSKARFGDLDSPLRGIAMPLPVLPKKALLPENTGIVQMEFFIEPDGSVHDVMAVGAPHELLAQISREAVLHWKFGPPTAKGKPARPLVSQEFRFVLE